MIGLFDHDAFELIAKAIVRREHHWMIAASRIPVLRVAKWLIEEFILQFTAAGFDLGGYFLLLLKTFFLDHHSNH